MILVFRMEYGCPGPALHLSDERPRYSCQRRLIKSAVPSGRARETSVGMVSTTNRNRSFRACTSLERPAQPGHQTADDQPDCDEANNCYLVDRAGYAYAEKRRDEEVVQAQKGRDGDRRGRDEVSTQRNDQDHDQAEEGGAGEIEPKPITAVGQQQHGGEAKQCLRD